MRSPCQSLSTCGKGACYAADTLQSPNSHQHMLLYLLKDGHVLADVSTRNDPCTGWHDLTPRSVQGPGHLWWQRQHTGQCLGGARQVVCSPLLQLAMAAHQACSACWACRRAATNRCTQACQRTGMARGQAGTPGPPTSPAQMLAMREPYRFCTQHTPQCARFVCGACATVLTTARGWHQPMVQGFAKLCCHHQAQPDAPHSPAMGPRSVDPLLP